MIDCTDSESLGAARFGHLDTVMISIVLYGRNDSYGYNLHKRAALSLNCMAEILTDPADEILFVDYNTPDDFPTFPEAIQDTLTKRAREVLRILRVRPRVHDKFKSRTHLLALEPIARNVGVRRSSPHNRWIVSTNSGMILIPRHDTSLSEIATDLAPGFYSAPRIEIPEVLWESLDRRAPGAVISTVREWGTALRLNEIALGSGFIRDNDASDFRFLLRGDLFENYGFDEDLLQGLHVDSNIAARMLLKYTEAGDLGSHVFAYHCDHTRQATPAHRGTDLENDGTRLVTNVTSAKIERQAESWGCAGETIEEVRLAANPASIYVQGLRDAIGAPLVAAPVAQYVGETYNQVDYDPRHLMPYLADMFVSIPRSSNLGWFGAREDTLTLFARIWERLGFTGEILLQWQSSRHDDTAPTIRRVSMEEVLAESDAFVFDFGGRKHSAKNLAELDVVSIALRKSFRLVVREERRRLSRGLEARRVIALNAVNNRYETFVCGTVAAAATPFATHMRHGFVLPESAAWGDWLAQLSIGEAGFRVGKEIRSDPANLGWIAHGPHKYLEEGSYLLSLNLALLTDDPARPRDEPCISIQVTAGNEPVAVRLLRLWQLKEGVYKFAFQISRDIADGVENIETRIWALRHVEIAIRALTVEPVSALTEVEQSAVAPSTVPLKPLDLHRRQDLFPFLLVGEAGRRVSGEIRNSSREIGRFAYCQIAALEPGTYRLNFQIAIQTDDKNPCVHVMVKHGPLISAIRVIAAGANQSEDGVVFAVPPDPEANAVFDFTFEVVSAASVTLRSLTLEPEAAAAGPPVPPVCQLENWIPFLRMGQNAIADHDGILVTKGLPGYAFFGPYWTLPAGRYELIASIIPPDPDSGGKADIAVDVATAYGERQLAACRWRLGQYRCSGAKTAIELRLPFTVIKGLAAVLPIETRLYTEGDGSCRIRSLAVRVRTEGPEHDLFPYLVVGECGIHSGGKIRIVDNKAGCIAYTMPMDIESGHYELLLDLDVADATDADARLTGVSIRGLRLERTSKETAPRRPGTTALAKKLAFFDFGAVGAGGNMLAARRIEFTQGLPDLLRTSRGPSPIFAFEVPTGLPQAERGIQIRIDRNRAGALLIRSIALTPGTTVRKFRDKAYVAAGRTFRKLQAILTKRS